MVVYIVIAVIVVVAAIFLYHKRKEKAVKEVPQGVQAFDERGNLIFDLSHSTSRFIGSDQLSTSYPRTVSKTISVAKNSRSEKIFFYLQLIRGDTNFNIGFNGGSANAVADDVNDTITFTVKWGTFNIYYGVYVP